MFAGHRILETARALLSSGRELEVVRDTHPDGVVWLEVEQHAPEWRAVIWCDDDDPQQGWLVAAGKHQADSGNDFWAKLERVKDLATFQPTKDDRKRFDLEAPTRETARDLRSAKEMTLRAASDLGVVQKEELFGAAVEVVVTRLDPDIDSVLVGITVRGAVEPQVEALIMRSLVPGSDPNPVDGRDWVFVERDERVLGDTFWEMYCEHSELLRICL